MHAEVSCENEAGRPGATFHGRVHRDVPCVILCLSLDISLYLQLLLLFHYTSQAVNMPVENNGKIVTLTTESVSTSPL